MKDEEKRKPSLGGIIDARIAAMIPEQWQKALERQTADEKAI